MDFDALKDLVKTITRNKVKHIEVLGNPGNEGNMVESFYDAIAKDVIDSDEAAARLFYGENESPKSQAYLRLKRRLERSLLNTAFFVDVNQPMFNERSQAWYNCYRDFAAGYILLGRDATKAGIHVLEQVLEQAMKYEFIELTTDIAGRLRSIFARDANSITMHERYTRIHREYEAKRRMELMALEHYEDLITYYMVKRSPNKEIHELASRYYEELKPLTEQADTCLFHYYASQIGIIKHMSVNNIPDALEIAKSAFELLKNRKNANRDALVGLAGQKLACTLQLRMFEGGEGDETANYILSMSPEGSYNWFRGMEVYMHYSIYARKYENALELYLKASENPKFEALSPVIKDNWQLYGGYLHLLAVLGKLPAAEVEKAVGKFRYAKLSNEITVLDKDKQGMNIPLVLLPVIYSLVKGTFDKSDISPEALEKYRKRYLDNDMNRRSAAFLNMLIAYAKRDYQSASAEKKIKKELEILEKEQPLVAGQTYAVEIIPYEDIWAMMTA